MPLQSANGGLQDRETEPRFTGAPTAARGGFDGGYGGRGGYGGGGGGGGYAGGGMGGGAMAMGGGGRQIFVSNVCALELLSLPKAR